MQCPVCKDTRLVIADRRGIEIDYCPDCRGVWLDRGELDKIIEKTAAAESRSAEHQWESHRDRSPDDFHSESRDYDKHPRKRKKRRGLLGELFDFD